MLVIELYTCLYNLTAVNEWKLNVSDSLVSRREADGEGYGGRGWGRWGRGEGVS